MLKNSGAFRGASAGAKQALFYPLLILVVGLLTYLPGLGSYGLLDPTDSFFLESGRESLETGQYLLPLNNYEPWLDKPILFFWMVELSFKLFGLSPFAGRLPAALSAVACALLIYAGSRPLLKRRTAALAALIFLSAPLASIVGHVCLTDMTLTALIAGSMLFLFKGLQLKSKKDLLVAYFSLGLAVLCKGPIAIVIAGIAFLPYLISISKNSGEFLANLSQLKPILGAALVLALNLPWYIAAALATNGQFLITFFWTQNFGRMVGTVNHQGPFWFYLPVFFGGFFPWCLFSLATPGLFKKTIDKKRCEPSTYRRLFRFCLFWFSCMMIMFSIIKTKLPTYILPALPAFAILAAMQLELIGKTGKIRKLVPASLLVTIAFVVGLAIQPALKGYVREIISHNLWIIAPVTAVLGGNWLAIKYRKTVVYACSMLLVSLLVSAIMVPIGLKTFYKARQTGFNELAARARNANASVAMIFAEEPSIPWTTHKPVSRLHSQEDALKYLKEKPAPHYVFAQTAVLGRMSWFPGEHRQIAESGKWHLYFVQKSE